MDLTQRRPHLPRVLGRVVIPLFVLAVALIALTVPAHKAMMAAGSEQSVHPAASMPASDDGDMSCASPAPCGAPGDGSCAFVCAGFVPVAAPPAAQAIWQDVAMRPVLPPDAGMTGRAPALNDRPPKGRLL